jgi:hypothetical protein
MIKTDVPGISKVSEGVLINTDKDALQAYKKQRTKNREFERMKEDVSSLKTDMQEIKEMLKKVLK